MPMTTAGDGVLRDRLRTSDTNRHKLVHACGIWRIATDLMAKQVLRGTP